MIEQFIDPLPFLGGRRSCQCVMRLSPFFFQCDKGWKNQEHGDHAEKNAPSGDPAQFHNTDKVGQYHGTKCHSSGDGTGKVSPSCSLHGFLQGLQDFVAALPFFLISFEDMDAEIDTQSNKDGGKHYGKNIQVANGQGSETHGPEIGRAHV